MLSIHAETKINLPHSYVFSIAYQGVFIPGTVILEAMYFLKDLPGAVSNSKTDELSFLSPMNSLYVWGGKTSVHYCVWSIVKVMECFRSSPKANQGKEIYSSILG